jgi:hypothetical protein
MKEGIQSGFKDAGIRTYGCFLICIARLAEVRTGKEFSETSIRHFAGIARQNGILGDELLVLRHAELYRLFSGRGAAYKKLFTIPDGDYIVENSGQNAKGTIFTHFTCVTGGRVWCSTRPGGASLIGRSVTVFLRRRVK